MNGGVAAVHVPCEDFVNGICTPSRVALVKRLFFRVKLKVSDCRLDMPVCQGKPDRS